MKKSYIAILFLFIALSVSAQTHYESHIHVGVHGGASLSTMSFSPSVKQTMLQDITGGVAIRYAEERHVGLLGEINLTRRGWKENFEESPLDYSRIMTYIEMPIMTHIFFGGRNFKGFVNLGPQICYMIGSTIESNFDYKNPASVSDFPQGYRMTEQLSMDIKNKFDYGICAGIGVESIIKRRHSVMLEGRMYYGLGNVFGATKRDTFSASRGIVITVTLGYMFRLK